MDPNPVIEGTKNILRRVFHLNDYSKNTQIHKCFKPNVTHLTVDAISEAYVPRLVYL